MGGIGRSLCEWMVDRGAKHIIVMSRTARIDSFFAEMQRDIDVRAVSCDVSDKAQLAAALTSCVDMPPIRGVFQGAMTLRVSFSVLVCTCRAHGGRRLEGWFYFIFQSS